MSEDIGNILRHFHILFCVCATVGMAVFWGYKYSLDEDLCQIDYKEFGDGSDVPYPTMSMCFSGPFLKQKMQGFGTSSSSYTNFLTGDTEDVNATFIEYDKITINLLDYYIRHTGYWKNGSRFSYKTFENSEFLIINQTFNGFGYKQVFYKCFGIEVRSKEVDYFTIMFDQQVFPNKTRPTGKKSKKKEYFVFSFHYPKQLLATTSPPFYKYIWPNHEVKINYKMSFAIKSMEIVTRRNKRNKLCFDEETSYDIR